MGQIWSQIEKLSFLEIWDVHWRISMGTTRRGTSTCIYTRDRANTATFSAAFCPYRVRYCLGIGAAFGIQYRGMWYRARRIWHWVCAVFGIAAHGWWPANRAHVQADSTRHITRDVCHTTFQVSNQPMQPYACRYYYVHDVIHED